MNINNNMDNVSKAINQARQIDIHGTLYELLKENVEWYTTNGANDGTGATLRIEW